MSTWSEYWEWRQLEPDVIVTGNYKSFYPADKYCPIAPVSTPVTIVSESDHDRIQDEYLISKGIDCKPRK